MKPIYQYFFRGLITFLPVALTLYVLYLFIAWVESIAMWAIRPLIGDFYLPGLGIVIGVSAVITMVTVGNGATVAVQNQIAGLGTNLLQIRPGQRMGPGSGSSSAPLFKDGDAEAIATQIGGVAAAAPQARTGGTLVANGPAKLLARSTVIREAYLGADKDPATGTTSAADAVQRRKAVATPDTV